MSTRTDEAQDAVNAKIAGLFAQHSPEFAQVFLDLCAEQRALRKAGNLNRASFREGREDHDNRMLMEYWK